MAESSSWRLLSIIAVKHYSGYYLACTRCKRKARRIPEYGENKEVLVYKCPRCVSTQPNHELDAPSLLEWRYCVAIAVTDGHIHSNVVAFGDTLNPVLGVSAADLHRFLMENSKDIFGQSEFDQTEVPKILHSFLQKLLIGRYFKFLVQQTSNSPNQPMHSCAVVSRIVPLQTQLDIDLLTLLKCSYLGHELTKNETSVNLSTYHTPFNDQRELLYNRERTKDLSLVEIYSFTGDDSDLCTIAQTTQQTKEDTSLALELLCDLFTPSPSVCDNELTSRQPLSFPVVLNAKPTSNPPDETERHDCDLPSDLDLQLEIVRQLEADWLLTQTQPCTSFSPTCTERETHVSSSFDPKFTASISLTDEHKEIHTFSSDNLEHREAVTDCTQSQKSENQSSTAVVEQSILHSELFSPSLTEHIDHSSRIESPELFSAHPTPSTDQLTPIFPSPNHSLTDCRSTLRPLQLNYSFDNSVQRLVTSSTPVNENNSKRCRSTFVSSQQQERTNVKRKKYHHSISRAQTPLTTHCDSTNPGFSPDIL